MRQAPSQAIVCHTHPGRKELVAMLRSRLHRKFFLWGVVFLTAGGILALFIGEVVASRFGFPWHFALGLGALILIWVVPLWIGLSRWVLLPVTCILEADRRVAEGDTDIFLPGEMISDDEIGDMMRTRNLMLARLQEMQAVLMERAAQLERLAQVSCDVLTLVEELPAQGHLLKEALALTCQLTGARYGVLGLLDETGHWTQFVQHGLTEEEAARIGDLPKAIGMLDKLIELGGKDQDAVVVIDDLTTHRHHGDVPAHHPVMKTFLAVPIASTKRAHGRIYLTEKEGGDPFTEEDACLVKGFAQTVALALEAVGLEEEVQASERQYQELYDGAPVGLYDLDPEGIIVAMNQTFLSWLGCSKEEVIGKVKYEELLTEEGRETFCQMEERCRRRQVVENVELDLRRKDGRVLPARISAVPVFDEQGHLLACRGTARDVSREKLLEEQLLQAQKMEAVGLLAGGVAHDFNNMLQAIQGFAELSLAKLEPTHPLHRNLKRILESVGRAGALVQRLLAFSRRQALERRIINLNHSLLEISKMLRRLIPESIELSTVTRATVATVLADETSLEQIIMNLAVNARDAMPEGGRLVMETENVRLDEAYCEQHVDVEPGEYVCLTVTDTGVGMDAATVEHIFEPFFTTKPVEEGSGLGLSVVWGIVKQQGGQIEIFSQPGEGTSFRIYLPAHHAPVEEVVKARQEPVPSGRETILLGEDEELVRELAEKALEELGYTVMLARDGRQAVQLFAAHKDEIDLVILDVMMPKLGGLPACEQMRAFRPNVPVILMTGYSMELVQGKGRLQPGVSLLQKPFTIETLGRKVRELLDQARGS